MSRIRSHRALAKKYEMWRQRARAADLEIIRLRAVLVSIMKESSKHTNSPTVKTIASIACQGAASGYHITTNHIRSTK